MTELKSLCQLGSLEPGSRGTECPYNRKRRHGDDSDVRGDLRLRLRIVVYVYFEVPVATCVIYYMEAPSLPSLDGAWLQQAIMEVSARVHSGATFWRSGDKKLQAEQVRAAINRQPSL